MGRRRNIRADNDVALDRRAPAEFLADGHPIPVRSVTGTENTEDSMVRPMPAATTGLDLN
jgi:hypothetical protein